MSSPSLCSCRSVVGWQRVRLDGADRLVAEFDPSLGRRLDMSGEPLDTGLLVEVVAVDALGGEHDVDGALSAHRTAVALGDEPRWRYRLAIAEFQAGALDAARASLEACLRSIEPGTHALLAVRASTLRAVVARELGAVEERGREPSGPARRGGGGNPPVEKEPNR